MTELGQKEYTCEKCNFKCNKKFSWNRHLSTSKHLKEKTCHELENNKILNKSYSCECGKQFTHRQSLSVHRKKCSKKPTEEMLLNVIIGLVKTNTELTNKLKILEDACK